MIEKNIYTVPNLILTANFNKSLDKIIKFYKIKKPLIVADNFFLKKKIINKKYKNIVYIDTALEPSTDQVDKLVKKLGVKKNVYDCFIAFGGGSILDITKALSILSTNSGKCSDYVGWDLVKKKSTFKIAIPTLFGTGAEASKTCVFIDYKKKIKMGINSVHSLYDVVICDPRLQKTLKKDQFFYTAMDTYIHSMESLDGNYRNFIADEKSKLAIKICKEIFKSPNLMSKKNLEKITIASFLGGSAIGSSFVGFVHPLSSALSVNYKTKHCIANCIIMKAMKKYYKKHFEEFHKFVKKHKINLPKVHTSSYNLDNMINSTIFHKKPLVNKFGINFKKKLSKKIFKEIFDKI